jgi:hypothetical protein
LKKYFEQQLILYDKILIENKLFKVQLQDKDKEIDQLKKIFDQKLMLSHEKVINENKSSQIKLQRKDKDINKIKKDFDQQQK